MAGHNNSRHAGRAARSTRSGQTTIEFALTYVGMIVPLTFGIIYISELLWVWHSINDFTRQGASYATTHCWQSSADNVRGFMRMNLPTMIDQDQIRSGPAQINIAYDAKDPDSGQLTAFQCDTECTSACVPDTVTVSITGYQFSNFVTYLGLPPVTLPNFRTSLPMESAGCDPEQGVCNP